MADKRLADLDARLAKVAAQTREGFADRARALREAAARGAVEELARLAHRLRGVAGSAGHPELTEPAAELEAACARNDAAVASMANTLADRIDAAQPSRTPAAPRAALGWRVLAVDDDDAMRRMISVILGQGGGCTVTLLEDPRRAVGVVSAGTFDLVIIDAMMPSMNGLELYRALRSTFGPSLAIAILSAATAGELGWALPDDPRLRWVRKPLRTDALLGELRELVASRAG
jgi:CheY-like chemotaxis protein